MLAQPVIDSFVAKFFGGGLLAVGIALFLGWVYDKLKPKDG
jgi:hypothetical protein